MNNEIFTFFFPKIKLKARSSCDALWWSSNLLTSCSSSSQQWSCRKHFLCNIPQHLLEFYFLPTSSLDSTKWTSFSFGQEQVETLFVVLLLPLFLVPFLSLVAILSPLSPIIPHKPILDYFIILQYPNIFLLIINLFNIGLL